MTQPLDPFLRAYVTCALWSSTDDAGEPLDAIHDETDVAPETLAKMAEDCKDFQDGFASALLRAYQDTRIDYDEDRAGNDFWLTRNRHGAGFWDRGLGTVGDELTEAAHSFGSLDLYIGDDGKIHGA